MPKKLLWLIMLFTGLFISGVNTGDLTCLLSPGSTNCQSCSGVG